MKLSQFPIQAGIFFAALSASSAITNNSIADESTGGLVLTRSAAAQPQSQSGTIVINTPQTIEGCPSSGTPDAKVFDNGNAYGVLNQPSAPTTFSIGAAACISSIMTYHYNGGRGAPAGQIGVRDSTGRMFGPWPVSAHATADAHQGGGQSGPYWFVSPQIVLQPGTYTIVDSDQATWSHNAQNGGHGMAQLFAKPVVRIAAPVTAPDQPSLNSPITTTVVPQSQPTTTTNNVAQTVEGCPSSGTPEAKVFDNGNAYGVLNQPSAPTTFSIGAAACISSIMTYHYNGGRGAPAGQIGVRDSTGRMFGPWPVSAHATADAHQGGGQSGPYWFVSPQIVLQPGTYTIVDSDQATWSHNAQNGGRGMAQLFAKPVVRTAAAVTATPPANVVTAANAIPKRPPPPAPPKFKASDPCDQTNWTPRGAPWAAPTGGPVQTGGPAPATPAPPIDINRITGASLSAAVATAKEQLLQVYGGLTPPEMQAFQAAWAPIETYPNGDAVAYLNRLNPLLQRFVTTRAAFERAALGLQETLMQATMAVDDGNEAQLEAIHSSARRQRDQVNALLSGLRQTGAQIEALGNPPNPFPSACKAFKRGAPEATAAAPTLFDAVLTAEWVYAAVKRGDSHASLSTAGMTVYGKGSRVANGDTIVITDEGFGFSAGSCGLANPQHEAAGDKSYEPRRVTFELRFDPSHKRLLSLRAKWEARTCAFNEWREPNNGPAMVTIVDQGVKTTQSLEFRDVAIDRPQDVTLEKPGVRGAAQSIAIIGADATSRIVGLSIDPETAKFLPPSIDIFDRKKALPSEDAIEFAVGRGFNTVRGNYLVGQMFALAAVGDWKAADGRLVKQVFHGQPAPPPPAPPTPVVDDAAAAIMAAEAAKKQDIEFQQAVVKQVSDNLQWELNGLTAARADPKATEDQLGTLQFRVIQQASNLSEEQDRLTALQSGVIQHTRTPFEEYASDLARRSAELQAQDDDYKLRMARASDQLIDLAAPEDRERLRARIDGKFGAGGLARLSVDDARKEVDALHETVAGYWQGQAAQSELAAEHMEEASFYSGLVAQGAGMMVVGMSGAAFVEAYGVETAPTWVPSVTGAVYGATTGGIEGGPVGAVRGALQWSGTVGQISVDAYQGYFGSEDAPPGGWLGAIQKAGVGFLIGKTVEIGSAIVSAGVNAVTRLEPPSFTPPPSGTGAGEARFHAEMTEGRTTISKYEEAEKALADATAANRPHEEIHALETAAERNAAAVNASYRAKWLLKYHGAPATRRLFMQRVEGFYQIAELQMMNRLAAKYQTEGISFEPIRNAASAGSVGMDLDLALEGRRPVIRTLDGRRAPLYQFQADAQQAFGEAYQGLTGVSAARSDINLTTPAHSEAFFDKALLDPKINWNAVDREWVSSTADVTAYKGQHAANQSTSIFTAAQETCRQANKDIDSKLLSYFRFRRAKATLPKEMSYFDDQIAFWSDVSQRFRRIGTQETTPEGIVNQASDLMQATGGRSLFTLVEEMKGHLEAATKFVK